ncbi:MAG: c-type cytochrome biogenesis protein CcmI, partial [Defluviicoccus sp.]
MSALAGAVGALLIIAVVIVVWPLVRHRPNAMAADAETQALRLYCQQLAEIERACAEDGLDAGEADALQAEIKRRMLAVAESGAVNAPPAQPAAVRLRLT